MNRVVYIALILLVLLSGMKLDKEKPFRGIRYLHPVTDKITFDTLFYGNSLVDPQRKLYIDLYQPELVGKEMRPVILFVHGGGFSSGSKNHPLVQTFCNDFASRGYVVASIDYSLYMKGKSFHCDQPAKEKVKAFEYAVADIRRSVSCLNERSDKHSLNMDKVTIIGSSAGAEALLHAVFWPETGVNSFGFVTPPDFSFAGFVSFAGAIIDTVLIKQRNAIPAMLFHGTCDPLVPYASDFHHFCPPETPGALKLHGSSSIASRYQSLNENFILHTFCGKGHEIANVPMVDFREEIALFIYQSILHNKKVSRHVIEMSNDKKCNKGLLQICND